MSPLHKLTELQYSTDRKGPFALYIYEPNSEYHRPPIWFRTRPKAYDEEIPAKDAKLLAMKYEAAGREVRICDSGDMLVYHAKGGKILYGEKFWSEIA